MPMIIDRAHFVNVGHNAWMTAIAQRDGFREALLTGQLELARVFLQRASFYQGMLNALLVAAGVDTPSEVLHYLDEVTTGIGEMITEYNLAEESTT